MREQAAPAAALKLCRWGREAAAGQRRGRVRHLRRSSRTGRLLHELSVPWLRFSEVPSVAWEPYSHGGTLDKGWGWGRGFQNSQLRFQEMIVIPHKKRQGSGFQG